MLAGAQPVRLHQDCHRLRGAGEPGAVPAPDRGAAPAEPRGAASPRFSSHVLQMTCCLLVLAQRLVSAVCVMPGA